jgi:hypothetical protein
MSPASSPYPVRPIDEHEIDDFIRVDQHAFNTSPWSDDDRRVALGLFEFDRTLAAFDGTVAPPAGPGGTKYYDDNDWIGIELVRAYKLTHDRSLLASAEAVMAFEMAGWDSDPEHACPGGIPFSNATENTDRNTVTTAPAAELGAQLYRVNGNRAYLQFAQTAYAWVRRCLLGANGMYGDHISPKGVIEPMLWSYNQGSMIGAGTLLYQATGSGAYLYEARQTALNRTVALKLVRSGSFASGTVTSWSSASCVAIRRFRIRRAIAAFCPGIGSFATAAPGR